MQHKGQILEFVIRKQGISISELARKLELDRGTVYRHFGDAKLEDGIILKYAKAIKYDFSKEFPELASYTNLIQEPLIDYRPLTLSDALKEVDYWRSKYINLLEKHTELLQSHLSS